MNFWKVGSKYGSIGSVVEVFNEYDLAFFNDESESSKSNIEIGDLIAISEEHTLVKVGRVIDRPKFEGEPNFSDYKVGFENYIKGFEEKE